MRRAVERPRAVHPVLASGRTASAVACFTLLLALLHAAPARGQAPDEGGNASALAGAALGFYSAGMLGVLGSLFPCDRTLLGPKCTAASGLGAGAVGLVAGALAGAESDGPVRDRARGALYGAAVGAAAGAVLQRAVRQYGWNDAFLVAAFGAAVGAAPWGTLVGTGVGAALGSVAWAALPHGGLADLVMLTVVGGALGGLYDWVDGAVDARGAGAPALAASFSIPLG